MSQKGRKLLDEDEDNDDDNNCILTAMMGDRRYVPNFMFPITK